MQEGLLDSINSPEDLKLIDDKQIPHLCTEIRNFLIDKTEKNGGHLASNLGAVELTVAIHRIFSSPKDHIIFDVGHQSYVHKILTGRKDRFDTLRKNGGLSGFTRMAESEHDAFGAGHSSTSVSAALGYAQADKLNKNDAYSVVVLGDGAYTGGMIHEALNNCETDLPLIIVLNENGMSISVNKGKFAQYLSKARISRGYLGWKRSTNSILSRIPLIGKPIKNFLSFVRDGIKSLLFSKNYFEELGLYYIGPIDGNNYKKVSRSLERAKKLKKCAIVHLKTVKGKGYPPAEKSPDGFHSINSSAPVLSNFHSVFVDELIKCAKEDADIVAVTPAMGIGTGLDRFENEFADRYFDVGIAEAHAVTFAAGLAANGKKPYLAVYSTFLQRAYDSVLHDAALQSLPVRLMVDRASLALGDGATHHGIFDVSFLSHIPSMEIFSPISGIALRAAVRYSLNVVSPIAIRYPNRAQSSRIVEEFYSSGESELSYKINFSLSDVPKRVFITYGSITENVLKASDILKNDGIVCGVLLLERLKPLSLMISEICGILSGCEKILFVEEGIRNGGAGMIFGDELMKNRFFVNGCVYEIAAIDDNFALASGECDLYDQIGLSPQKISEKMK